MNFTNFTTSGTITLGTPSSLTSTSSNSVGAATHSHAITNYALGGTTNQITLTGAFKGLGAAGTISIPSTFVAPGTIQSSSTLTVGTGSAS